MKPDDLPYYPELEETWRRSCTYRTDTEWLKIFPEAAKVIPEKIDEWNAELESIRATVEEKLRYLHKVETDPEKIELFKTIIAEVHGPQMVEVRKQLSRLHRLKNLIKGVTNKNSALTDQHIYQARNIPICNFQNELSGVKKVPGGFVSRCCFHTDKHPSLRFYAHSNSFYCFGCHASGDVIDFVMQRHDFNFVEAVKYLLGNTYYEQLYR
jgi:hypothetical protein